MISNSSYRDEWIISRIKNIPNGYSILDVGCGMQPYKKYCEHLNYVSQDFNQYKADSNKGLHPQNWNQSEIKIDIISDITCIPVEDNSFDVILCTEVFEHIPYPVEALKEFYRILKPNGNVILTVPFNSITHFAPYYFFTGFSQYFFHTVLSDLGFRIEEIRLNGNYYSVLNQEISRVSNVINQYNPQHKLNLIENLAIKIISRKLLRLSKFDNVTNQLSCFGIFVFATKIESK